MADKKISELTSAGALAGTEVLPIVQSGETKKLALNAITTLGTIATGTWQGTQIANAYIATLTTAGKVANSATTATNANTASAIVARDASGNFTAGTITAALSGNASTATALQTARNINGVSFNGTADITVTAAAGTLTGATLASGVTASSLTSVGTLTSLAVSGNTTLNGVAYTWPASAGTNGYVLSSNGSGTLSWVAQTGGGGGGTTTFALTAGTYLTGGSFDGSSAVTFAVDATSANTASKIVARDASGNFSAGAITASSIVVSGTTSLNSVAYTWPATAGTNGQVLGTNGAGTLSWINAGGGGGGGTTTFPLTAGTYLTGGTFDGSAAVTFAVDGTSANTASKVVARDASGNFAASVITGTGFQLNTTTAATASVGGFRWEADSGTAQIRLLGGNVDLDVGEDSVVRVLNDTGSAMSLGQVVYITGAAGQRPTIALANAATEATSTNVIGLVAEAIANNQEGFVYTGGIVKGLNTFAFNEGDLLYLSATTAGALTNIRPTQPNHGVRIGYVVRKNQNDGHVYLAVNNGYEFEELHDVLITTPAANNMIRRNGANTLWVNIPGPTGDVVGTTDTQTLTNKTISGADNTLSNIGNAALTNSSVTVNGTSIALGASGTVTAAATTLTGSTLASNVLSSSLTSVGTIASGIWQGTPVTDTYLATISTAGKVANTATTATNANTAGAIVARNGSGDFSAGTITATLNGNASTATTATSATNATNATNLTGTSNAIRSVTYSFPAAQGSASTVLTNDGAGNLTWSSGGGGVSISESTTNATFYPVFYSATSGTATALNTDSMLTINPSTNVFGIAGTTSLQQAFEKVTLTGTTASGTVPFDVMSQGVLWYNGASANSTWTVNFRGNSTTTLNSLLAVGQSVTVVYIASIASTSIYPISHQIDGSVITVRWQGGVAPSSWAGAGQSFDVYTYTITKTAATPTYVVFGTVVNFA